jgi:anti-sigma B factor antagonist
MEFKIIPSDEAMTHVALAGELDMTGEQEVETRFMECVAAGNKPAVVDLSEVSFLASLGIRMLLRSAKALLAVGASMVLLKPQPMVSQVLEHAGITEVIPVARDFEQARKLLGIS